MKLFSVLQEERLNCKHTKPKGPFPAGSEGFPVVETQQEIKELFPNISKNTPFNINTNEPVIK